MHTLEHGNDSVLVRAPSISDAIDSYEEVRINPIFSGNRRFVEYGTSPYNLRKALNEPDRHHIESVKSMVAKLKDSPTFSKAAPKRVRLSAQEFGDDVNVDRYLVGDSAWSRMSKISRPSKIIKLSMDVTRHVGVAGGWAGAALCAVAEWLQGNGYKVAINVFDWTIGPINHSIYRSQGTMEKDWYGTVVEVKQAGMALDYGNIVAIMDSEIIRSLFTSYPLLCFNKQAHWVGSVAGDPTDFVKSVGIDYYVPKTVSEYSEAVAWLEKVVTASLDSVGAVSRF